MPLLTMYLTLFMALLQICLIIPQKGLSAFQFQHDSILKKTPVSIHASSPDTIIYDTVIIVKEPVIIRKEIFISDTAKSNQINMSAGLNAGLYWNYFIFSKNSQTGKYYSLWKNSHINKNSYSLNGSFSITYKNFGFRTGISFIRYNEDFNYSYFKYLFDTSTVIVTDTIDEYYVVQGADTIWHYVTQTTQKEVIDSTRQDYIFESKNKFNVIEIPVLINYRFQKGKFALIPSAGISLGYLISAKGIELSPDDTTKILSYDESNCLQKAQFSMLLGAELDYYFSDRLSIFAEIFYHRHFTSFYKNDFPVAPKIQALGGSIGIKCNF